LEKMMIDRQEESKTTASDTYRASMERAFEALQGLSCGDAFGECFFPAAHRAPSFRATRTLPAAPWRFTDDTIMAVSVYASLERHRGIDPQWLAGSFALHHDPERGYGPAMNGLLLRLHALGAENWFEEAQALFEGKGSMGNGAAMRVAPVGAYFAHDLHQTVEQATLSAIATHCHPEALAGAVAIATASALAWQDHCNPRVMEADEFLERVGEHIPSGTIRECVLRSKDLPAETLPLEAALTIGNGAHGLARDTIPFALWCAARSLGNYEEALWGVVDGGGDVDTNCAIVGGIVAMRVGAAAIPAEWLRRREPLDVILQSALRP
jgi:ADP-ribosylglycohydrolase